ncbi:uncharacterized protein LOC123308620 isoform X2 [Coccinella septempunctata]|nr:uncharacterized protein LOC123308620 isoform X2 [Coccinella septempunctata]XP_044747301.1 uncharacterized protein LOC123308620 isoform X2 [Coccinella septempunctata]
MESTVDSYLHKKFKKQLNYEPRNKNEINNGPKQAEQNQEKKTLPLENSHQVKNSSCRTDNTLTVPNTSTNVVNDSLNVRNDITILRIHESTSKYDCSNVANDSLGYSADSLNDNKSSISLENPVVTLQSHNISYVSNIHRYEVNFDTKFSCSDVVSNSHGQKSSILDTNLYKYNYVKSDDNVSPEREQNNQEIEKKSEETHTQPDKSTGGKYVCNYCNLACSKPSVLQKHIRAHTNERPYPCVSCGFSFKTRSNLYKHCRSRTHANRVLGSKARGEVIGEEQESNAFEALPSNEQQNNEITERPVDYKTKLYKPRFHTASKLFYEHVSKENIEDENKQIDHSDSDILSHHINELITKNNSKVNSNESYLLKRKLDEYNSEYAQAPQRVFTRDNEGLKVADEPLNLTNKVRKRCMSEAVESKSLIKEILLKNLASDMQCPHCKMIFQTVTELELHKLRNCKGFVAPGAKYARSSSVNVASILTQNKNAFDSMPQMQAVFPLKSPGPFLGKTRLVESDKTKSFSFDDGLPNISMYPKAKEMITSKYLLTPSSLQNDTEKKAPVKLFGGELKISENVDDSKRFQIENNSDGFESTSNFMNYGGKMSENRVIKSSLHSGGTVLTNKGNFDGDHLNNVQNVMRMYDTSPDSPGVDMGNRRVGFNSSHVNERKKPPDLVITFSSEEINSPSPSYMKYTNILDFSQNAVKLLTPNIKQPNLLIPGLPVPNKFTYPTPDNPQPLKIEVDMDSYAPQNLTRSNYQEKTSTPDSSKPLHKKFQFPSQEIESQPSNMYNPMNIVVNGKVVRYVPGMPGPVVAESPIDSSYMRGNIVSSTPVKISPSLSRTTPEVEISIEKERNIEESKRIPPLSVSKLVKPPVMEKLEIKTTDSPTKSFESPEMRSPVIKLSEMKSPVKVTSAESKKFARPNSLALKPTSASMKQHHGLTPTLLNQILISPDTPRVAKKYVQQYLNGNYFSYLGLKSTTRPVYCTLNKTQPSYVPHFKKLSMYSEWRQQDTKTEKFYATGYDSRQKSSRYTVAGPKNSDLMAHSSYKFSQPDSIIDKDENQKPTPVSGGYECNDDYTYIRGRGRGRYVCEQCGIRCKKPSMLKKHIRTHSNDRPYTCSHCNFSFKTKGNLTKHMKSKAHTKNSTSVGSNSSTQQSGTPSSESETDDSGMDSSDESTRQQEHEAAYGLLSLSQKSTHNMTTNSFSPIPTSALAVQSPHQVKIDVANRIMNTEEIAFVTKTNYAKNKCLEQPTVLKLNIKDISISVPEEKKLNEVNSMTMMLGKSGENRPLTYPYVMSDVVLDEPMSVSSENTDNSSRYEAKSPESSEPKCITQFHVIQRYAANETECTSKEVPKEVAPSEPSFSKERLHPVGYPSENNERSVIVTQRVVSSSYNHDKPLPSIKAVDNVVINGTFKESRKRKILDEAEFNPRVQKLDGAIDLSVNAVQKKSGASISLKLNNDGSEINYELNYNKNNHHEPRTLNEQVPQNLSPRENSKLSALEYKNNEYNAQYPKVNGNVLILKNVGMSNEDSNGVNSNLNVNYIVETPSVTVTKSDSPKLFGDFDNSAMETLADIATKQVKLEKNAMAKSVASEYLKLATKNEFSAGENEMFQPMSKEVNDLIVKPEGSKSCTICSKSFSKPSQLRLHMNVHYLERPFRCEPCSVSFRTKGHLQKHERSASHHNKLSSSPAQSSSEPRPFKCTDCNIAFRIHGHLAKHLRSKMHIMKLECLAKIPFGLYAELERSNSLLTEINTADGDQCLDSLRTLAKKVFMNDPAKLKNLVKSPVVVETE